MFSPKIREIKGNIVSVGGMVFAEVMLAPDGGGMKTAN